MVPLGFLCDHVEVLYDLDIEAAQVARTAGSRMVRAATVGDHPLFIRMMAAIVAAHLADPIARENLNRRRTISGWQWLGAESAGWPRRSGCASFPRRATFRWK